MHGQLGLASDLEVFWFAKQFNLIVVCKIFTYKNKLKGAVTMISIDWW